MNAFNNLLLFFAIYSFLGWVIETSFASINERKFVNRGFLNGCFCPIYGFGAVLILCSDGFVSEAFGDSFSSIGFNLLFSVVLVTVLECITGFLLERIFDCKWWDYSENALNFRGYICLQYSVLWGILAFLLVRVVHPVISSKVSLIPLTSKSYLAVFLIIYFLADTAKSVVDALDLRSVILNHSNVSFKRYHDKIIQYKRLFLAFPRLLKLNAGVINRDIRSIINGKLDKIKVELKTRFLQ